MDEKIVAYFGDDVKEKLSKDYNYDLFSNVSDSVAYLLSKHGVESFKNGSVIRFLLDQNTLLSNFDSSTYLEFEKALSDKQYWSHPFSIIYNMELRAKFLLQTSKDDDFNQMKEELFKLLEPVLFESKLRLPTIKDVMKKAESRLFSSRFDFIGPIEGHEQNDTEVVDEEYIGATALGKLGDDGEIKTDNAILKETRTDNHDMLALKELLLVLNKEKKIDKFSIALSFFNKYLPELDEMGFKSIMMTVKDGYIVNIQLTPYLGEEKTYKQHYAPQKVASTMSIIEQMGRFPEGKKTLGEGEFVFISALGYVATKDGLQLNNFGQNIMDKVSLSAETFVYEQQNDNYFGTRVCFTPMNYEDFPILLRTGSVIFGLNDYTFHSAVEIKPDSFKLIRNLYLNEFTDSLHWSESWVSARYYHKNFTKQEGSNSDLFFFYREENEEILMKIINSYYEEFPYTIELYSKHFSRDNQSIVEKYMKNIKPLHKRLTLSSYVTENSFNYTRLDTTWKKIADSLEIDSNHEEIKRYGLREKAISLAKEKNIPIEEAVKQVLGK